MNSTSINFIYGLLYVDHSLFLDHKVRALLKEFRDLGFGDGGNRERGRFNKMDKLLKRNDFLIVAVVVVALTGTRHTMITFILRKYTSKFQNP